MYVTICFQADKVRSLKSTSTDKNLWKPEIAKLLELKQKLAESQKTIQNTLIKMQEDFVQNGTKVEDNIKGLEEDIERQVSRINKSQKCFM